MTDKIPFIHFRVWRYAAAACYVALAGITTSSSGNSAELPPNQAPSKPEDWGQGHRIRYQELTLQLDGPQMIAAMPQVASFSNAALYNLKNNKPSEYKTIIQRNAFYDLTSLVIEFDPKTKPKIKPIRFFHAATRVTARLPLGAVDWAPSVACSGLNANVRSFMRKINEMLFAGNMPIIQKLMFVWNEPRDPRIANPTSAISAWDFDLAMVEYEQDRVTEAINDENLTSTLKANINNAVNCEGAIHEIAMLFSMQEVRPWLDRANIKKLDFFNVAHRKALGKALVTIFHKRPEAEFRKAIGLN